MNSSSPAPRILLVAITKHGLTQVLRLAELLPGAQLAVPEKFAANLANAPHSAEILAGPLSGHIGRLFAAFDQLVFFVSLGAVVRLIAPHVQSKERDPGVLVVDDAGRYVIPVLSGHVGGANAFAERLAGLLDAQAVLTTASDVGRTIPVDILGRELGWELLAPKINVTRVSAHVVNQELIALVQEAGSKHWWTRPSPLPANIHLFERFEDVDLTAYRAVLWVTRRQVEAAHWQALPERLVVYRPPLEQL